MKTRLLAGPGFLCLAVLCLLQAQNQRPSFPDDARWNEIVAKHQRGEKISLGPDGTHPSLSGRAKAAHLLMDFLKTDPTAKCWVEASQ